MKSKCDEIIYVDTIEKYKVKENIEISKLKINDKYYVVLEISQ